MDRQLYDKVSAWFDGHREEMIEDLKRLVRIESVSQPGADGTPFGAGCLQALEEMLAIGREHGFDTENYDNIVGSIGSREKIGKTLLASGIIWMWCPPATIGTMSPLAQK